MNQAYLLLGGNLGSRDEQLKKALELLGKKTGKIKQCSGLYETQAWGITTEPNYLNQAVLIETALSPQELLHELLSIEQAIGRDRKGIKWTSRIIDIDILFYNNEIINTETLQIPHPRLQDRKFALVPLLDIAERYFHPVLKKNIAQLLKECPDNLNVWSYTV